ncbi:hypothetical protein ACFP67_10910 [Mammaliicoccus sciuri]|uniref:hypothetical protein n=1 Tax=Mammaliicoccus sciuri TaxID=1296 RepID=UPI000CD2FFB0|nr:hypothetical protein [Mammaliicoccus sciuri]PNZ25261.1 hypothetical protein CD114_11015 [Mammaliicoccus sciuri]
MTKEVQIRSWVNPSTQELEFIQTHVDAVIGLDEKIEEHINQNQTDVIILRSPEGREFRLTVDNGGEISAIPIEEG